MCDTADRAVGWIALEDFGDAAEARIAQVVLDRLQQRQCGGPVAVDTVMRLRVWPEQPGPDRTLVVAAVATARAAYVVATVVGIIWVE